MFVCSAHADMMMSMSITMRSDGDCMVSFTTNLHMHTAIIVAASYIFVSDFVVIIVMPQVSYISL